MRLHPATRVLKTLEFFFFILQAFIILRETQTCKRGGGDGSASCDLVIRRDLGFTLPISTYRDYCYLQIANAKHMAPMMASSHFCSFAPSLFQKIPCYCQVPREIAFGSVDGSRSSDSP
jgi:hypothetical protein